MAKKAEASRSPTIGDSSGSLGAAVGLLFYLYIWVSVALLGAELNAATYNQVADTKASKRNRQEADARRT